MPTPVPKYRAHAAHAPLTCHTLNTQHFTDCGQTTTPQCACAAPRPPMHEPLPVPPSPTVSSAGVRARLHARGQRPWPCKMRHKAKATTHMAQGSHARSGTLYPNTLAACSCTRRLGGVTHLKGTRSREWCTVVWRGAPSYSRFEIDLDRLGQVPHNQAVTSDLANP